jgi:hypothetical protein
MSDIQELKETAVADAEIPVHEEHEAEAEGKNWTEEFTVASEELFGTVKKLLREVTVRRLVVKNEKMRIHLEIPLAIGVVGIAWLPVYSAIALIAALVTDCTILVERREE